MQNMKKQKKKKQKKNLHTHINETIDAIAINPMLKWTFITQRWHFYANAFRK